LRRRGLLVGGADRSVPHRHLMIVFVGAAAFLGAGCVRDALI
jgi:hypothetical protein